MRFTLHSSANRESLSYLKCENIIFSCFLDLRIQALTFQILREQEIATAIS